MSQDDAVRAIQAATRAADSDTTLVTCAGHALLHYQRPESIEKRFGMASCTKSLVAVGVGRVLTQGKISSLDQPVSDFYPEWKQGQKASVTLRMLMNHTSGLQNVPRPAVEIDPAPDVIKLALAAELSDAPGQRFLYNNK